MSVGDEQQPLSRRERRRMEMDEAGMTHQESPAGDGSGSSAQAESSAGPEVEISPFDADGRPRTRREIRELREQMLAAMADDAAAADQAGAEAEPQQASGESHTQPDAGDDADLAATQAFSLADLEEAQAARAPEGAASDESAESTPPQSRAEEGSFEAFLARAMADEQQAEAEPDVTEPLTETPHDAPAPFSADDAVPSNETAQSGFDAEAVNDGQAASVLEQDFEAEEQAFAEALQADTADRDAPSPVESFESFESFAPVSSAEVAEDTPPVTQSAPDYSFGDDFPGDLEAETSGPSDNADLSEEKPAPVEYSFPDIVPLGEGASVFDDPATRTLDMQGKAAEGSDADFDDLISSAVAEESGSTSTNTSALILPNMPQTGDLSGPIGETGELFVTGSIELPRSLSETGGHSALHDSVEQDSFEDLGFDFGAPVANTGTTPVAASRAVSARTMPGPVVTEAKKEANKLPVILMTTGGVLLLGIVGIAVWGVATGVFG